MYNIHKGETCLIVGNGSSLKKIDDDFLKKYKTFGTNRCYLKFVPDYYVCVNPLVLEQNQDDIRKLESVKFVRDTVSMDAYPLHKGTFTDFSFEPLKWVNEGYTVTHVCLQLAYWMGFETVLLVGVDHDYKYHGGENQTQVMTEDDPNHFDPNYFKGQTWQTPDLKRSEKYYLAARRVFEKDNRKIINLTPRTKLEVFEKDNIKKWS